MNAKKLVYIVSLFLVLTIVCSMLALPIANASDPPRDWPVVAYVLASPNPVGVGQSTGILMFTDKIHPMARGMFGGRFHGWTVTITAPDNSTETLGPFDADAISFAYTSYTPTQVGTYKIVFHFPDTVIVDENPPPAGWQITSNTDVYNPEKLNDTFVATDSLPYLLTVQENPVKYWADNPLPTDYWTSPINSLNRNWWIIAGDWLGGAQSGVGKLMPYTTGPESAHVLWTKPFWSGGIAGGEAGGFTYLSSAGRDFETPFIINGRIYMRDRGSTSATYGWSCIDLYTGETIWYKDDIAYPSFASVLHHASLSQMVAKPYLWSVSGSTWSAVDAYSGKIVFNITNAQATGTAVYSKFDGAILRYRIVGSGANKRLTVWNTTQVTSPAEALSPDRPGGYAGNYDGLKGFSLNVSIPDVAGSIFQVVEGEHVIGGVMGEHNATHTIPGHIWTLSLQEGMEGKLISNVTFTPPMQTMATSEYYRYGTGGPGVGKMHGPFVYSEWGVFLFYEGVSTRWWGYSLETGQMIWGPTEPEGAMKSYSPGVPYPAYGILYTSAEFNQFGGEINAYNITTGEKLWTYYSGNPLMESPGVDNQPLNINFIADGKIYATSKGEHIPVNPMKRDGIITCIDAYTGEALWKISYYPRNALAISRGYVVGQNSYDGLTYVYGKGPSATTVSGPDIVQPLGTPVLLKGAVTDQSPGAPGTPAIADENQREWMEHLYMQQPMPMNVTGVTVSLDVLDPNGNFVNIGTATTDASGMFKKSFVPEIPGDYTVIASFAGSKSYGSSSATTAISVYETEATPSPTEAPQSIADMYFIPAIAGLFIAIIAVGILVVVLLLKKRP